MEAPEVPLSWTGIIASHLQATWHNSKSLNRGNRTTNLLEEGSLVCPSQCDRNADNTSQLMLGNAACTWLMRHGQTLTSEGSHSLFWVKNVKNPLHHSQVLHTQNMTSVVHKNERKPPCSHSDEHFWSPRDSRAPSLGAESKAVWYRHGRLYSLWNWALL